MRCSLCRGNRSALESHSKSPFSLPIISDVPVTVTFNIGKCGHYTTQEQPYNTPRSSSPDNCEACGVHTDRQRHTQWLVSPETSRIAFTRTGERLCGAEQKAASQSLWLWLRARAFRHGKGAICRFGDGRMTDSRVGVWGGLILPAA